MGLITGLLFVRLLFDWEPRLEIESNEERERKQIENRKMIDRSICMSCTRPVTGDAEFCMRCGYNVGKHKIKQEK